MPEVRLLTATTGETNVFLSTWLHSIDSAQGWEERVSAEFPDVEVVDHAVVLRTVKRQGWILDELGRRLESAPIDPWYDVREVGAAPGADDGARSVGTGPTAS